MKRTIIILLSVIVLGGAVYVLTLSSDMKISSDFRHNGRIAVMYTCDADNISPPLEFSGVPEKAVSLALIVDDPDAVNGTWNHWTVWNINPKTTRIATDSVPEGAVEGVTSLGTAGYGGPCPRSGEHRYVFTLYALDTALALGSDADVGILREAMSGNVIDSVELIGLYGR